MVAPLSFKSPAFRRAGSKESAGTTAVGMGVAAAKVASAEISGPVTVAKSVAAACKVLTTGMLTFGTGLQASAASSSMPSTRRGAIRWDMKTSLHTDWPEAAIQTHDSLAELSQMGLEISTSVL